MLIMLICVLALLDSILLITVDCNWTPHSSPELLPVPVWFLVPLPHPHIRYLVSAGRDRQLSYAMDIEVILLLTFNSVANDMNASVTFLLSLADVSIHNRISGMYWQSASASANSTSRRSSISLLLPIRNNITFEAVYRRTSSIHRCKLRNEDLFVMS